MVEMTAFVNGSTFCAVQPSAFVMDDVRRARELYRYLQPDNLIAPHLRRRSSTFDTYHDHVPSLSKALSPFCQLASLRCNAAKAMLNVMDRDVMYFLAEASMKRSHHEGEEITEFVEDPILMSCSSVPLKGRICELTLRTDKSEDSGRVPTFVINDLSKSQFAEMNIVAGPPYYRFYAGVPIETRKGVNIGSIAIMDTKARPDGLTRQEEEFLGDIAEQIMTYLETNRQAIEGRRSRRLAQGLEAFIGGKKSIMEEGNHALSEKTLKRRAKAAYGIALESDNEPGLTQDHHPANRALFRTERRSNSIISLESGASSSAQTTDSDEFVAKESESGPHSHGRTFARAANLLRECLGDLGEEGSVHFVSLATRLGGNARTTHSVSGNTVNLPKVESLEDLTRSAAGESKPRLGQRSYILASSTISNPIMSSTDDVSLIELSDDTLRELMRRHPGGCLWSLDESALSSSEDDSNTLTNGQTQRSNRKPRKSSRRKISELKSLRAAFPEARQILFTPVWDSTSGSFAYGCFIASSLETRSFNASSELPFLNSFCSTVMAECSRVETMMADKQKSDFVGTISHEMRSPLHGVLASVEFLADTDVTSFQQSLIETIDSCGRTLLDTINHVLDFSKVNSFQKQWQAANKKGSHGYRRNNYLGPENSSRAMSIGAPPLLQLFGVTDISVVLEEVVDGLVLGQTYNSGIDITDTSKEARGRMAAKSPKIPSSRRSEPVEIILDVEHGDWTFMTQPGAVRRIIMNITGNAMKYTSQGTIHVQLRQKDAVEDGAKSRIMVLTVTDTGKGISPEFLASRLFIPFAQENALAPGTGLGMSIVRSIVLMLGGTIDVKSRVGKGTTVEVAIPMKRPLPGQVSSQSTPHSGGTGVSGHSSGDESILLLQNQVSDETVAFYRPKIDADEPLMKAVHHYIKDWYNLECIDQRMIESSSVVIVEEEDLEQFMTKAVGTPGKRPVLVIMCSVSSRHSTALIDSLEQRLSSPVEFVARPCGPNKLARSIRSALEKKRSIKPRFAHVTNLGAIPEASTPGSTMTASTPCDPAGKELHELDLGGHGHSDQIVQATETFAASQSSQNAQMAIHDPSPALRTPRNPMSDHDAFPFPVQSDSISQERREGVRSRGASQSEQRDKPQEPVLNGVETVSGQARESNATGSKIDPHVLLVDDNKINLKLLETFLRRKRNYSRIEQAEDGQQAVNAVKCAKEQYDIIFMDISMPVMNGFEATRAIRDYEDQCNIHPGVMVIALTGLASGRDQSEGFNSGCDLYMTKPVSFKEVGKLLDNWEGHQIANSDFEPNEGLAKMKLRLDATPGAAVAVNGDHV